jgi:hypothetical protein
VGETAGLMDGLETLRRISGGEHIVGDTAVALCPFFQREGVGELGARDGYMDGV